MARLAGFLATVTLIAAACSTSPPPSDAAFASAGAACRSLAYDQGYEVVEIGESQSVPGGITMSMQLRKDGQTETRSCMFSNQHDRASFQ